MLFRIRFHMVDFSQTRDLFDGWQPGTPLASSVNTVVIVKADDIPTALEKGFAIGNRMAKDELGESWSSEIRSVSVGDVAVIRPVGDNATDVTAHAVRPIGWEQVSLLDVLSVSTKGHDALVEIGAAR